MAYQELKKIILIYHFYQTKKNYATSLRYKNGLGYLHKEMPETGGTLDFINEKLDEVMEAAVL